MIVEAVAVRFQPLPEVIDLSFVLTFSGLDGLLESLIAALARFDPDRLARFVVLGNIMGAAAGTVVLLIGVLS